MATTLAVAAICGLIAYWKKSKTLGVVAGVLAGVCFPIVLLGACACLLFPALFWASWHNRSRGYSFVLLATTVLSIVMVYWRMPQHAAAPVAPIRNSTAMVRQIRVVDEVWSNTWEVYSGHRAGEKVRASFEMVDFEFTPEAASEPIHVLDRIDLNSVPNIREGSIVSIMYSVADPDLAQITGATHTYVWRITAYLSLIAYGAGAIVTFVFVPIRLMIGRFFGLAPALRCSPTRMPYWGDFLSSILDASDKRGFKSETTRGKYWRDDGAEDELRKRATLVAKIANFNCGPKQGTQRPKKKMPADVLITRAENVF